MDEQKQYEVLTTQPEFLRLCTEAAFVAACRARRALKTGGLEE